MHIHFICKPWLGVFSVLTEYGNGTSITVSLKGWF